MSKSDTQLQLESLAMQAPSLTPQLVHVSSSTCRNLSLFKDLLKEYRRLDDTIIMRLNRANAVMRDQVREGKKGQAHMTVEDQACSYMWKDLIANWSRRDRLINYCSEVVDKSVEEKQRAIQTENLTPAETRKIQAQVFSDEVQRNQIHNELMVEAIVRRRTIEAFRSRCKYFTPPLDGTAMRKVWESSSP